MLNSWAKNNAEGWSCPDVGAILKMFGDERGCEESKMKASEVGAVRRLNCEADVTAGAGL